MHIWHNRKRKEHEKVCLDSGLSWECVLNKREAFQQEFDEFDLEKVCVCDKKK